ncbi:MAG: hypothetical protein RMK50_07065 [Nitrososphaerota archaeon]|nr:hypothetical protein [Candidatus Bathyarchaeota archaeon]MDW8194558.1 hypothetical protein [Nitrososphaerota archaeon]
MRNYIFTRTELDAIEEFIKTRRRNPTVNKVMHYIKHNKRLWVDIQLFLELHRLAHHKPDKARPKLPPGRPPKIL